MEVQWSTSDVLKPVIYILWLGDKNCILGTQKDVSMWQHAGVRNFGAVSIASAHKARCLVSFFANADS